MLSDTTRSDVIAPPDDEEPAFLGYSVGKWQDDYNFVVETTGTDARTWLDNAGRPHSEDLRVTEVFHRVDHDTLELSMTIDDPKSYTAPWTVTLRQPLVLDSELLDYYCLENEKSWVHMK
jgi:hypothetical protein